MQRYPYAIPPGMEVQYEEQQQDAPRLPAITCAHCEGNIHAGERAVEIQAGALKPGRKSGRLMVQPEHQNDIPAVVHEWCAMPFLYENVIDDLSWIPEVDHDDETFAFLGDLFMSAEEERERLCATCEAKIYGDEEEEEEEDA